jgi:hypothetical protein
MYLHRTQYQKVRSRYPKATIIPYGVPGNLSGYAHTDKEQACTESSFPAFGPCSMAGGVAYIMHPEHNQEVHYEYIRTILGMTPHVCVFINLRWQPAPLMANMGGQDAVDKWGHLEWDMMPVSTIVTHLDRIRCLRDRKGLNRSVDRAKFWHADKYHCDMGEHKYTYSQCIKQHIEWSTLVMEGYKALPKIAV